MTLEEAIWREEALAYSFGERYKRGGEPVGDLPKLEEEHRQNADWLRELEWRRSAMADVIEAIMMPASMAERVYEEMQNERNT